MTNRFYFGLTAAMSLSVLAAPAFAHHGSNGQFDTSKDITVSGTYKQIKYVNPHAYIYFDVTNASGNIEDWRCEMTSGSLLKRRGWTPETIAQGAKFTVTGNPAWREPQGCKLNSLTFEDGRVLSSNHDFTAAATSESNVSYAPRALTLSDGTPNIFGNWLRAPRPQRAAPAAGEAMAAPARRGPPPAFVELTPSEAGMAANEGWVVEDLPRLHCKPVNIFHDWWFDGHVNTISQGATGDITLAYGFMDIVRTVHMDMDAHPSNITPSVAGHSIGKWDNGALVVDTTGFEAGYLLDIPGIKHSDQLTTTERFYLSEDGKTLKRDYEGEDPLYLAKPFKSGDEMVTTQASFDSYECDDLTQEIVAGGFGIGAPADAILDASAMGAAMNATGANDSAYNDADSDAKSWLWIALGLLAAGLAGFMALRKKDA